MNKWYFTFGASLLFCIGGSLQAQETQTQSSGTKIIIIEEKVDRSGNKTVTKTVKEGNFTDAEIDQIIEQESQGQNQPHIIRGENQEEKGYLGVMIENAEGGVRITEVIEGSPAQKAGLQTGDVVMAVNQTETANMESLVNVISSHKVGESVQVHYRRDGTSATANATLVVREEPVVSDVFGWEEHVKGMKEHEAKMKEHDTDMKEHDSDMKRHDQMMKEHDAKMKAEHSKEKPRFGVTIDEVEDGEGVVVTSVYEGSIAEKSGLQEGDIIKTFNGVEVNSSEELIEAVKESPANEKVKVEFVRDGKKMKEKVTFTNG